MSKLPPQNASSTSAEQTFAQYNRQTKLIHWVFLLMFIIMVLTGKIMTSVSFENPLSYYLPQYHYLLGLVLCVLLGVRFKNWRNNRFIKPVNSSNNVKWFLARTVQFLLLLSVLMLIVSGYALATMDGTPALLPWGSWLPQLLPDDTFKEAFLYSVHKYSLIGFFTILVLHLAGAILNILTDWRSIKRIV